MTMSRELLRSLVGSAVASLMAVSFGIGIAADSIIGRSLVGWLVRLTVNSGTPSFPVTFQCWNPLGIFGRFTLNCFNHRSSGLFISTLGTRSTFTVVIDRTSWWQQNLVTRL